MANPDRGKQEKTSQLDSNIHHSKQFNSRTSLVTLEDKITIKRFIFGHFCLFISSLAGRSTANQCSTPSRSRLRRLGVVAHLCLSERLPAGDEDDAAISRILRPLSNETTVGLQTESSSSYFFLRLNDVTRPTRDRQLPGKRSSETSYFS